MNITKLLTGLKYSFQNKRIKLESNTICGVPIKTTRSAVRTKVDQDDAWFFYLAKYNKVIYDIGCNIGYTALLAMIQDPLRNYLLVDPNPQALNEAHLNLTTNNLGFKANYFSGFVGDEDNDCVKFYTIGSGAAGSIYSSHSTSAAAINSFSMVNTVTLDYLYDLYNLKPDLVKIDVEGSENMVMAGAYNLAKNTKCTFFIEMHSVEGTTMEQSGQLMLDWCAQANYSAWYLAEAEELKLASTIGNRGKCHLLLIPKGEAYPKYLKDIKQNAPLPESL